jgi:hypothetical protein
MEKKRTAVEWLDSNLIHAPHSQEDFTHNYRVFEQAKEMHKEQIKDAYEYGNCDWEFGIYIKGEQYYNETYGK